MMRNRRFTACVTLALLLIAGVLAAIPVGASPPLERATSDEAAIVAQNWVRHVIVGTGEWAGSTIASVIGTEEIRRDGVVLGYVCPVSPEGCVVVSLYKGLAPVKFYTDDGDLDLAGEEGLPAMIKDVLQRVLDALEGKVGPLSVAPRDAVEAVLEIDYRASWDQMLGAGGPDGANYAQGGVMVDSEWHQSPPYNDQCPDMTCSWTCNINTNALVGCVATAGAQIMRYWNWPPYGVGSPYNDAYDWVNMLDTVPCGATAAQINAVAELCAEVGTSVSMSYGCGASSAWTWDMVDVFEDDYRYSTSCNFIYRSSYTAVNWFNLMKAQFNVNRPVQYRIPGHSIVSDGWRETGNPVTLREYHINYGWGGTNSGWFTLDAIPGGNPSEEYMVGNIVPAQAIGPTVSGTYSKQTFNYRYFDMDAAGSGVFSAGQFVQFLPGVVVSSTGTIQFNGTSGDSSRLFARGNTATGVRIYGGAVRVNNGGEIRLP